MQTLPWIAALSPYILILIVAVGLFKLIKNSNKVEEITDTEEQEEKSHPELYFDLSIDDIREALQDTREIEDEDRLNEELDGRLGHQVYVSILEELKERNVIGELRDDLIDLEKEPEDFEKVTGENTEYFQRKQKGAGFVAPPEKKPESLAQIAESVKAYLMCLGNGFYFDWERIYSYEKDYSSFLEDVLSTSSLENYDLEVESSDEKVMVRLETEENTYESDFSQSGDRVRKDAIKPIGEALKEVTGEKLLFKGGNDGSILILPAEEMDTLRSLIDLYYFGDRFTVH